LLKKNGLLVSGQSALDRALNPCLVTNKFEIPHSASFRVCLKALRGYYRCKTRTIAKLFSHHLIPALIIHHQGAKVRGDILRTKGPYHWLALLD